MVVREATPADAEAVAVVHVRSWQAAYAGVLPDEFLAELEIVPRRNLWEREIAGSDGSVPAVLVAETSTAVVGFVHVRATRDDDAADVPTGEVTSIYVDPGHWSEGVGQALLTAAESRLRESGFQRATLWVLVDNDRARRFYEAAGWRPDGAEKDAVVAGVPVREIRYLRLLPTG